MNYAIFFIIIIKMMKFSCEFLKLIMYYDVFFNNYHNLLTMTAKLITYMITVQTRIL